MNAYQQEHADAFRKVSGFWETLEETSRSEIQSKLSDYLVFRKDVDRFLETHFKTLCTLACFQSRLSACCSREGIIVFFADVVINYILSEKTRITSIMDALERPNTGDKCVYLTECGCLWMVKPIICQMFLCGRAERDVLERDAAAKRRWNHYQVLKRRFIWPDRQVLFDDVERVFMASGIDSPLMYLHKSPGLMRIKKEAGIVQAESH